MLFSLIACGKTEVPKENDNADTSVNDNAEQDIDIYFTHIGSLNRFSFDRQIPPNEITA